MQYLKRASRSATDNDRQLRTQVEEILQEITRDGEAAVKRYALKFDRWRGEFLLSNDKRESLIGQVPEQTKQDIQFAYEQVKAFAQAQTQSIQGFEISTVEGVKLGQKVVPVNTAGCYVPGGRYAHAVPALMSIATAKAAGVKTIIACSPPKDGNIYPAPVIGD